VFRLLRKVIDFFTGESRRKRKKTEEAERIEEFIQERIKVYNDLENQKGNEIK